MNLKHLTDALLLTRLQALVCQERGGTADLIEPLAEVDRREIVLDKGFPSLFDYCVKVLRYSEAAAFLRIRAARAAAKYPRVLADLRAGTIHLDAVMRLYPHLSEENSDRLLTQASGASKREVLALVATLEIGGPAPERDVVRRLPARLSIGALPSQPAPSIPASESSPAGPAPASPAAIIAPSRIRLAFTADDEFLRMVEHLRSLCRHKFPEGRLEDLLKESVQALLARIDPARKTRRRPAEMEARKRARAERRVSAAVKAAVWKRDDARCAYAASDGRRCDSRDFLEYDHIVPWALGGQSTVDNIRLLCRAHNQRLAKRRFGPRPRVQRGQVRPDAVDRA